MANDFTKEQQRVIDHIQGNLVVSASAGSGKTRVMIERIINIIAKGEASVKEILAVTFTKLAAAEIRDRLSKAIVERMKEGKDVDRMREELDNLSAASISTIDSFLNSLVKKYFYLVDVDPHFNIVVEGEQKLLKSDALDEVLERLYEEGGEEIELLSATFNRKRKNKNLREIILKFHEFVENETDSEFFYEKCLFNYTEEGVKNIENLLIARFIKEINDVYPLIENLMKKAEPINKKYFDYASSLKAEASGVIENQTDEWLKMYANFRDKKPNKISKGSVAEIEISDLCNVVSQKVNATKEKIEFFFTDDRATRLEKVKKSGEILKSLIKTVKLFDEEYRKMKRERNLLDYADLSHLAYKLLNIKEVKEDVTSAYKFILVDEYQDTNDVQNSIFKMIENRNLFIVGDLKQSIYGFRGCDSRIFKGRIDLAEQVSAHVELAKNFRSSKAVINAVNKVFSATMTLDSFGVDYKSHQMIYGDLYEDYRGEATVYEIPEKVEEDEEENEGVYSIYKHLKSGKIEDKKEELGVRVLVEKCLNKSVFDVKTKKMRPVKYGDIAILVRKNKETDAIVKELDRAGIPVVSESKRSIGEYPEIATIINILQCVYERDNDVALAAALKSPMGGLTDRELLEIRRGNRTGTFVEAYNQGLTRLDLIGGKLRAFSEYLKEIRLLSNFEGAFSIVRRIMNDKGFYAQILSSRGGEFKLKRIDRFLAEAKKGDGEMSVGEFLDSLETSLKDMTLSAAGGENAVKVISMHSSKGLEYPVVIIAKLSEKWNMIDAKQELRLDRLVGVGVKTYDEKTKKATDNLVSGFVKLSKGDSNFQDELRLLYVAMTRAKCILNVLIDKPLQEEHSVELSEVSSHHKLLAQTDMDYEILEIDGESGEKAERRSVVLPDADPRIVDEMEKFVNFSYPHQSDTKLSLKRSVTAVAHKDSANVDEDEVRARPIFGGSDVETGNAYHRFLEVCDFDKSGDNGYIDRLFEESLTESERGAIDKKLCEKILKAEIFKKLKGYKLYKEQPFIVTVPPALAGEEGSDDILLQGTIDLLAIKGEEGVIVDYKHSGASEKTLVERYKKQLELYAFAVEKALNVKITDKYILNLKSGDLIKLS